MIRSKKLIILSFLTLFYIVQTYCIHSQLFQTDLPKPIEKKTRKRRMRKPKKEEKKRKIQTYMDMTYEELLVAKDRQKDSGNLSSAIKYVEQLMKLVTDINIHADHLLELADLLFLNEQYKKAERVYEQYCALYPGSSKQEYALYRSIISSFKSILSIDRDQTKTEETLVLATIFLDQDHFTTYKDEVLEIQKQCYEHLFASELSICHFYLVHGKFGSAEKRLKKIRELWIIKLPNKESEICALEMELAEQKELAIAKRDKIVIAQNKKKRHMARRF